MMCTRLISAWEPKPSVAQGPSLDRQQPNRKMSTTLQKRLALISLLLVLLRRALRWIEGVHGRLAKLCLRPALVAVQCWLIVCTEKRLLTRFVRKVLYKIRRQCSCEICSRKACTLPSGVKRLALNAAACHFCVANLKRYAVRDFASSLFPMAMAVPVVKYIKCFFFIAYLKREANFLQKQPGLRRTFHKKKQKREVTQNWYNFSFYNHVVASNPCPCF